MRRTFRRSLFAIALAGVATGISCNGSSDNTGPSSCFGSVDTLARQRWRREIHGREIASDHNHYHPAA